MDLKCDVFNTQITYEQWDKLSQDEKDYLYVQAASVEWPMLGGILNRVEACNLTVCPRCRVDDFTHVEGCLFIPIESEEEV